MKKKRVVKNNPNHQQTNFCSDLSWCIKNDLQVYIVPIMGDFCRIAIRKGGITTEGKPYKYVDGVKFSSHETLGKILYKNQVLAQRELPEVYRKLREKYGKE